MLEKIRSNSELEKLNVRLVGVDQQPAGDELEHCHAQRPDVALEPRLLLFFFSCIRLCLGSATGVENVSIHSHSALV